MRRQTITIVTVIGAVSFLAASCGGSDENGPPGFSVTTLSGPPPDYRPLAPRKLAEEQRIERRIDRYCAEAAAALTERKRRPSPAELDAAVAGIRRIAEMARREPDAVLPNGADVRLRLSDIAENLEGENCSPEIRATIDEQLATIPQR